MYYYTGSNLFGQWSGCDNNVKDEFTKLADNKQVYHALDLKAASLVYIGWSYNIFYFKNMFYIVGDYKNSGQYIEQVSLPKDCTDISNITIVTDEYNLVIVNKNTCMLWFINLETREVKKNTLTTEMPIENVSKRSKQMDPVLKCEATNGFLMFMTCKSVYCGLIPSLADTSHCIGEPVDIQCGNEHFMLLTSAGRLYTWGNGRRLQLGHGDLHILDTPTEVEALAGIKIIKISAGGWHSLALSEYGDLYGWGWNDTGQLGIKENANIGVVTSLVIPTLIDIYDDCGNAVDIDIKEIACGSRHSALLLDDGSVWTTGQNKYGQLGLSIEENPSNDHFQKCCSFENASGLMCGQWSTVVNVLKPYISVYYHHSILTLPSFS